MATPILPCTFYIQIQLIKFNNFNIAYIYILVVLCWITLLSRYCSLIPMALPIPIPTYMGLIPTLLLWFYSQAPIPTLLLSLIPSTSPHLVSFPRPAWKVYQTGRDG